MNIKACLNTKIRKSLNEPDFLIAIFFNPIFLVKLFIIIH